ncbi:copper homeostasis protein CutC [Paenibacillus daejeonensis]|uniref:copper homeostasis protein CutC n=1 Tax=Paenibacillus daejeonensis TaxID=135193 RepID=UPI000371C8AA|nr:copper homeostasis protein CutC [Paenibacillus daejeonensis]
MLLEVIATTLQEAKTAARHGADRIELVTALTEGGLTPSIGTTASVLEQVDIPVRIMVRPHSRGFVYDADDLQVMRREIRHIRHAGGSEIVLGVLRADRTIDTDSLEELLAEAEGMKVTFHRAFDEVPNQLEALRTLTRYPQITDVLTSGGRATALDGAEQLYHLHREAAATSIQLLAGSGLSATNAASFMRQTGIHRLHVGTAVRTGGQALAAIEPERVATIRELMLKRTFGADGYSFRL